MRIAYFTDTYAPQINGVTNTLNKLSKYLRNNDHEYLFLAPQYVDSKKSINESTVYRFKSILFPPYPECRLSIPYYSNLCAQVDEFKPDIIHLVTPLGIGLAGLKYAKSRNIPVVASFHTNFDVYLKYYNLTYLEPLLWKFFKKFHNDCLMNFSPSYDTLLTLEKQGINDLRIWSRGIDTDQFSPNYRDTEFINSFSDKNYDTIPLRFLYTGRIAAEKDLDILIESMQNINKKYHDKIEFVFVGDGPYKRTIQQHVPDNVIFTGYLKGEALSKTYASCDVFAFPSSTETLGNVVLEAMASGLPVIAVNSGGVIDNVHHNVNGILANPRDVESFSNAIIKMIENNEQREHFRSNALKYVQQKTWESIFDQLTADYKLALNEEIQIAI